jgi:hypothetical protein
MRWNSRRSGTGPSSATASLPLDEIGCRAEAPARINGVMASSAQSAAIHQPGLPLVRRGHTRWLVRAPGRQGALSPEEAAHALKAKRADLRKGLDWRRDVAGMPAHVRDEIVDEAIGLVVMSSKPIRSEEHLQGAFWASIGYLLVEYRSGRRDLHVGSRRRVDFEPVADVLSDDSEPRRRPAPRPCARPSRFRSVRDPSRAERSAALSSGRVAGRRTSAAAGKPRSQHAGTPGRSSPAQGSCRRTDSQRTRRGAPVRSSLARPLRSLARARGSPARGSRTNAQRP